MISNISKKTDSGLWNAELLFNFSQSSDKDNFFTPFITIKNEEKGISIKKKKSNKGSFNIILICPLTKFLVDSNENKYGSNIITLKLLPYKNFMYFFNKFLYPITLGNELDSLSIKSLYKFITKEEQLLMNYLKNQESVLSIVKTFSDKLAFSKKHAMVKYTFGLFHFYKQDFTYAEELFFESILYLLNCNVTLDTITRKGTCDNKDKSTDKQHNISFNNQDQTISFMEYEGNSTRLELYQIDFLNELMKKPCLYSIDYKEILENIRYMTHCSFKCNNIDKMSLLLQYYCKIYEDVYTYEGYELTYRRNKQYVDEQDLSKMKLSDISKYITLLNTIGIISEVFIKSIENTYKLITYEYTDILSLYGMYYFKKQDGVNALMYFYKELVLLQYVFNEETNYLSKCYSNIGSTLYYLFKDQDNIAIQFYKKDLELSKQLHGENSLDTVIAYNNLAVIYDNVELFSASLFNIDKAKLCLGNTKIK